MAAPVEAPTPQRCGATRYPARATLPGWVECAGVEVLRLVADGLTDAHVERLATARFMVFELPLGHFSAADISGPDYQQGRETAQ